MKSSPFALLTIIGILFFQTVHAQLFTRQDSLRGSITPERVWWDLTYYNLSVSIHPEDSTISGTNEIYFTALTYGKTLQIELQEPLKIESIKQAGKPLKWEKDGYSYFIKLKKEGIDTVWGMIVDFYYTSLNENVFYYI